MEVSESLGLVKQQGTQVWSAERIEWGESILLKMGPVIYACCTVDIRGKSFVLLFHICWLLFTYPANALALESFLQYAGERGGRE